MAWRAAWLRGLVLAVIVAGGACASAPRVPLADRPTVPPAPGGEAPADSLETVTAKIRHLSWNARPRAKKVTGITIEASDPRLAAALFTLAAVPGAVAHRRVALEYLRLGIRDAAFDHFRRATIENPRDGAAFDGLARIWRDWGLPGLGLGESRRAVYFSPGSAEAHNTLGTILQALGRRKQARQAYARALELSPGAAYALNNLCYVSLLDGRSGDAVSYCRQAIAVDGTLVAARHNLALVYAGTDQIDLAWNELVRADSEATAAYNLGIINLARGEAAAALVAFESACRAKPRHAPACERADLTRARLATSVPDQ